MPVSSLKFTLILAAVIYVLVRVLQKLLQIARRKRFVQKQKEIALSPEIKAEADGKLGKLLNRFRHKYGRYPQRDELFGLIVQTSHITIRKRGIKGHWARQRIRKYLLEKHGVVKNFIMR